MELTGKIDKITSDFLTGKPLISLEINEKDRLQRGYDELRKYDKLSIKLVKYRKKRSQEANKYMWHLCDELARVLSDTTNDKYTKDDIYRRAIKEIGVFKTVELDEGSVNTVIHAWQLHGTGWIGEKVDNSRYEGLVIIRLYYGSSTYDTKQMSRLINNIVADCKELGIETMTPKELERLTSLWRPDEKHSTKR